MNEEDREEISIFIPRETKELGVDLEIALLNLETLVANLKKNKINYLEDTKNRIMKTIDLLNLILELIHFIERRRRMEGIEDGNM